MDASAIQTIADLAQINEINAGSLQSRVYAVPNSARLESIERFEGVPDHFRGNYNTTVLDEYVLYINKNADEESGIFINPDEMSAKAIIDLGSHELPKWGKHKATAKLKQTPAYTALLNADNITSNQQELIDWLEDWESYINFYDADNKGLDFKRTIRALRRIKFNANLETTNDLSNFATSRSTLEQIELKAGYEDFPVGFIFECEPYEGFSSYRFACQLRAMPNDKDALFKYRIGQLEAQKVLIADEFKQMIKNRVQVTGIKIYLGEIDYQS